MSLRRSLLGATLLTSLFATQAFAENTFKFAFQGTLKSLDPYSLNETFTLGTLNNVYEGLTRRGADLQIMPALAERWEVIEPTRWRFHLRKGVKFHNGNDFTAADVVFSADRVRSEGSDLKTRIPADAKFEIVDDHTVDVVLTSPNPILHFEWDTWGIVDKEWSEANDSVRVTSASDQSATTISLQANGTGPFKIESHDAGVKTTFTSNADWWDAANKNYNVDTVEFSTISSDATRVAALLSGEMDMVYPIPVQDIKRVNDNGATSALTGPELRTIFLGMDQRRDELLYSDVKGKNPFKDQRVREAFYHAIDIEAIKAKVMRDLSTPSAIMISPFMFDNAAKISRLDYDPDAAKALLKEAGYENGFEVGMDCPNDRYVNDEAICQAVVAMLARIGVKVNLNAQPKAQYFAKVLASGGFDTSFYLLGWTPGSFDSWNVLSNLIGCRDDAGNGGMFNLGGYCNEDVDALTAQVLVENDPDKRLDLITQAYQIVAGESGYIPLHQQGLAWGVSDGFKVTQRADNTLMLYHVNKN
ncbi:ABC transporter substrate-binding protein [Hoeflea prorocentri]|uniref:ABC transporter substrate-binding protein n=1 Tax=Hoeflea prorocentri TaxID=1922333 RepID=A0A9X3ULC2_9HYPH|nr:ABC transporter substrate-binding protein [Hoeflea prorocentri]MCY6381096.1 ABC transporter substrate-binding protein [Hoeflea prorocentri]MDA5398896.1 ABC transporter substrate-binding protein [Hoeflea prorocentri]